LFFLLKALNGEFAIAFFLFFLIPLIFLNIFIPPIRFTTHTIEYNLCLTYLLPLLCSHQCDNIFVVKILYLLPLME
jgi:hypothetical protein